MAGYYWRFIKNFSKIVFPLTWLKKKTVTFCSRLEQHPSFETLIHRLCQALILTLPEGVDDFVVSCDASITGLGVELMQ